MALNLPVQVQIVAPSYSHGLPTAKPGETITLVLQHMLGTTSFRFRGGAVYVIDPFGARVMKIPFHLGERSQVTLKVPLKPHLLSGIYTVGISFKESKIINLAVDKKPFGGIPDDFKVYGCFRLEGGHPTITTYRVTYEVAISNQAVNPLRGVQAFLAVPPPLPPRQAILDLKSRPSSGRQANDLIGNNWLHFLKDKLPGKKTIKFGYTALIRNRSVRYTLPQSQTNTQIPARLESYTKPENFIESHHHLIKKMAQDLAHTNPTPIRFTQAAMKSVAKTIRYTRQRDERGAAFAIEKHVGDCTEYAALFAALCRANGIPARLEAGFAYNGKEWERHAWSQVWVRGHWIPVDPTWYGSLGLMGITCRHIPLIIGNWMSSRIRQEFTAKWLAPPNTEAPKINTKWNVKQVIKVQDTDIPALPAAPAEIDAKVPDAVPQGTKLNLQVSLKPIPKTPRPLDQLVMTATLSDGEMDQVIAIEPFSPCLSAPINLAIKVSLPHNIPRTILTFRLWVDRKPSSTVWTKTIGLL